MDARCWCVHACERAQECVCDRGQRSMSDVLPQDAVLLALETVFLAPGCGHLTSDEMTSVFHGPWLFQGF